MGAGFNLRINNQIKILEITTKNVSTDCMYHLDSIFNTKVVGSGGNIGGYCEAKGSGGCAFETSTYSFDIGVKIFENNVQKTIIIATISGTPGSGRSDDGFSRIVVVPDTGFTITRDFIEGDTPSFTYTVSEDE